MTIIMNISIFGIALLFLAVIMILVAIYTVVSASISGRFPIVKADKSNSQGTEQ